MLHLAVPELFFQVLAHIGRAFPVGNVGDGKVGGRVGVQDERRTRTLTLGHRKGAGVYKQREPLRRIAIGGKQHVLVLKGGDGRSLAIADTRER